MEKKLGDETNLLAYAVLDDLRHNFAESKGKVTKLPFEVLRLIRLNYTNFSFSVFFSCGCKT